MQPCEITIDGVITVFRFRRNYVTITVHWLQTTVITVDYSISGYGAITARF